MIEEENKESKKSIFLNENNNINNLKKKKMNEGEVEEKLEIISEEKNNKSLKKKIEFLNDNTKNDPILIINNDLDFRYNKSLKQIRPVSLRNLGKSCFLNSSLQCFFHCSNFTSELLENHKEYEKIKSPVLSAYLKAIKNLYTNGKESCKRQSFRLYADNSDSYDYICCCKRKKAFKENIQVIHFNSETIPTSAEELYSYIIKNNSNSYLTGSDPKIVAEMILSTMNKEIDSNFKYIRDKKIPKNEENLLFEHIFNYYENKKTVVSSNFYWIKERISICNECEKETYNFNSDYIFYFYPEAIINGLNLKIDNNKNKYIISLENCFEYFHISEQLDVNSFTCCLCNKRVKSKSILNYMATLPKYLVICMYKDKDEQNPINYILDYNEEIDLSKYYKNSQQNNYSNKYQFHSGCFLNYKDTHAFAFCKHFDGAFYKFDDNFYEKYDCKPNCKTKFPYPYLLIYRRDDINI